jgi:hypothetical protein
MSKPLVSQTLDLAIQQMNHYSAVLAAAETNDQLKGGKNSSASFLNAIKDDFHYLRLYRNQIMESVLQDMKEKKLVQTRNRHVRVGGQQSSHPPSRGQKTQAFKAAVAADDEQWYADQESAQLMRDEEIFD